MFNLSILAGFPTVAALFQGESVHRHHAQSKKIIYMMKAQTIKGFRISVVQALLKETLFGLGFLYLVITKKYCGIVRSFKLEHKWRHKIAKGHKGIQGLRFRDLKKYCYHLFLEPVLPGVPYIGRSSYRVEELPFALLLPPSYESPGYIPESDPEEDPEEDDEEDPEEDPADYPADKGDDRDDEEPSDDDDDEMRCQRMRIT
ncbi:hypothetical protein Tco_1217108 [Tanacetum coccineum]